MAPNSSSSEATLATHNQQKVDFTMDTPTKSAAAETFKFSDLQITKALELKKKPDWNDKLQFGKEFTDHMLLVKWTEADGWTAPAICPFAPLELHPAAKVFHYAAELYEGMKAYRGDDSKIRIFRPDLNMARFVNGARRASLPPFDPCELLQCIVQLVQLELEWIPNKERSSLYIRPALIGTDGSLGINRPTEALLFVILCPVGPYFESGFKPVSLLADPQYIRSWKGGCGDTKMGANYAPTVFVQKKAEESGCQQVLWLHGENQEITEAGTMNFFLVILNEEGEKELVTPPLNGLILSGITRQSILELVEAGTDYKDIRINERPVSMAQLLHLSQENRVLEAFGSGTACTVCPVNRISYQNKDIRIPTLEQPRPLAIRLNDSLMDIYYGRTASMQNHSWSLIVSPY